MAEAGWPRLRMLLLFPGLILLGLWVEKTLLSPRAAARAPQDEVRYWQRHAESNPSFAPAQVRLALAYQRASDWPRAAQAYAAALALDADSEEAAVGRSDVLRREGRRDEAVARLEEFTREHPACVVCLQNLAAEYLDLGRIEPARRAVERLLASDLTLGEGMYGATDLRFEAWLLAGRVYAAAGDHARALELFREATRRDPADLRGHLFQARSQLASGQREEARSALAEAQARLPGAGGDARWRREIAELEARLAPPAGPRRAGPG
jgi:tetratricopeptide (TPR) repeat protein